MYIFGIKPPELKNKTIPLFYWSERIFSSRNQENYGDLLSKYLVERISKKAVRFVHPKKQPLWRFNKKHYLGVGSILQHATTNSIVWGSGIIDTKQKIEEADFRAVRGPKTRNYLMSFGHNCPEIYGDPAILLPQIYKPEVNKEYRLGIIPHYKDFDIAKKLFESMPEIKVIDLLTLDVESTTREILSCEYTISSSLHGLIVSHVYRIPSLWVKFSDQIFGDDVKYDDYLSSLNLEIYSPPYLNEALTAEGIIEMIKKMSKLPVANRVSILQKGLLEHCPFNLSKAKS